jgi:putative long chain acyl-CoA synthase
VRRYGVTVASYTWTLLHDLVEAPPHPGERHHPLRLFIGSGMPRSLWKRVERRFQPARVVEFYASTEAGAILVNLRDAKPGSMGRPLPGSAEVRIAAYDIEARRLVVDAGGFAKRCGANEVGMLLVRVSPNEQLSTISLRSVFTRDDAWTPSGDLFWRDQDGDYWRVDSVGDVIRTVDGPAFTIPIRDALGELPAVDLAVAYGVLPDGAEHEVAVAAITLRRDRDVGRKDIAGALSILPRAERPAIVHVVDQIPVTTWFRPRTGPLRAAGIPEPSEGKKAWYRDATGDAYRPLTAAARRRLARRAS